LAAGRKSDNRIVKFTKLYQMAKGLGGNYAKWLSLIMAGLGIGLLSFVKLKFVFESGNTAQTLVFISMFAILCAFVFGIVTLPRWQGFVAIAAALVSTCMLLFTRLYGLS
jgi:hypothetical protein